MKTKNLAKEYALARLQGRLSGNEMSFSGNNVFTEEDIETAFNAGRRSIVENIPDLEWEFNKADGYTDTNGILGYNYHLYVIESLIPNCRQLWSFAYGLETPEKYCNTKEGAMKAANEDYKKRVKELFEQFIKTE